MDKHTRSKPLAKSSHWPKVRLIILTFNVLFILNLLVFSKKSDKNAASGEDTSKRKASSDFRTIVQHHEGSLLSQCEEDAFDLRNERHRNHKSPFDFMCSKLTEGQAGATAASLWKQHAEGIFNASMHPLDEFEIHAPWIRSLQKLLTPFLLERGLRATPQHYSMQSVMRIIQNKLKNPDTAPPLEVLVVGGSVTEGGGCETIHRGSLMKVGDLPRGKAPPVIRGGECAWPYRWQRLIDAMIGPGVIRIHNLAVGGTNSFLAVPVLDYWLFPEGSPLLDHGPDVIINGYAANDNLPPPDKRGDDTNTTADLSFFYKFCLKQTQAFVRTCLESRPCFGDPLVLFVDEYLGNQHDLILGEMFRFEAVDLVSNWYGTVGSISSAQVIRRLIYAKTDDKVLSPVWKRLKRGPNNETKRVDVHAGMASHVLIAWTAAYSMLTMALDFCEEETSRRGDDYDTEVTSQQQQRQHQIETKFVPAETLQLVDQAIPPILDAKLEVKDVATRWNADAIARNQSRAEYCAHPSSTSGRAKRPCSFAFVAAPMGTVGNEALLNNYVNKFVVNNDGWRGQKGKFLFVLVMYVSSAV